MVTLSFVLISGCDSRTVVDPKDDPEFYCKPFAKPVGGFAKYVTPNGESEPISLMNEFKTAAGFKMRIPWGSGGLSDPNEQCKMQSGEIAFRWSGGKLLPEWNANTGARNPGSEVKYFVWFRSPSENRIKKIELQDWMLEGAIRIPSHDKILFLPFADLASNRRNDTINRNDRSKWQPVLLLEGARDSVGNPIFFYCLAGLSYVESAGRTSVTVNHPQKYGSKCKGGPRLFADGAGGALDIYDEDFLGQGAAITNAVLNEIDSYIVKE